MQKEVKFQTENFIPAWASEYSEKKFTVFSTCFLSTKKNSHGLEISEDVLRKDASTILGNFLVAKIQYGDSTTHTPEEIIYGYFPKEQEIEFDESEEGIVKAKAYCVISKMYGKEFNEIFSNNNLRNTSVEMMVEVDENDEHKVVDFDIFGLTCLGTTVNGSCPDANMQMVRFSKEEAENFFKENESNSVLKNFAKNRKACMEEEKYENHSIDTSKEALYDGEWDGSKAKQDLVKEKNYKTLAKKVCLRLEDGWEEREITKLGYPVMGLHDGKWVYFKKAIASALSYAKQENDEEIVNKVEKLYKKLDIEKSGKEGESKMAEIEFAAVDIGNLWDSLYNAMREKYQGYDYSIKDIYEEDNQKFAIIRKYGEDTLYRLDFSLTEEGLALAEEIVEVKAEFEPTDNVQKFAEPENVEKYKTFAEEKKEEDKKEDKEDSKSEEDKNDDKEVEMSCDEMKAKIAELESAIEEKDNIIMKNDTELKELRDFKKACMEAERATKVETVMSKVTEFMDEETAKDYRKKGMECDFAEVDAWANEVKALAFDKAPQKKAKKNDGEVTRMSAPIVENKKTTSVWERL